MVRTAEYDYKTTDYFITNLTTLSLKLKMKGISLIFQKEAYSSGCSPTSKDVSKEYYNKTKRIKRGLFKDGNMIYNSDSVGAYNIMRIYKKEKGEEARRTGSGK